MDANKEKKDEKAGSTIEVDNFRKIHRHRDKRFYPWFRRQKIFFFCIYATVDEKVA
jgi:hypothetical protein